MCGGGGGGSGGGGGGSGGKNGCFASINPLSRNFGTVIFATVSKIRIQLFREFQSS